MPDLALVCRRAEARGYGIVVQLAESGPAPPRDPPASIPPGLPDPPPPVRILGLRLRAHSPERAITQWRDVLQGELGRTPEGGLVFRWSASPLRLVVDVDPTAPEGPTAIEVASERGVASLDAASARLGIRLLSRSS